MPKMYAYGDRIKKIYAYGDKISKVYAYGEKVWTGSSLVTYIVQGDTVQKEVDAGSSILDYTPAVGGYKFFGWSYTNDGMDTSNILETCVATGDPMKVYAIFLPTTLTVYTGSMSGYVDNGTIYYPEYITKKFSNSAGRGEHGFSTGNEVWYADRSSTATDTFTINLGAYKKAIVNFARAYNNVSVWYDGGRSAGCSTLGFGSTNQNDPTSAQISGGSNGSYSFTLSCQAKCNSSASWVGIRVCITSIVLSM